MLCAIRGDGWSHGTAKWSCGAIMISLPEHLTKTERLVYQRAGKYVETDPSTDRHALFQTRFGGCKQLLRTVLSRR